MFKEWFIDNPDAASWEEGTFSDLIERTISGDWEKDAPSGNSTEMVYCIRGTDIPEVRAGNKGNMSTQSTGRVAAVSSALLA